MKYKIVFSYDGTNYYGYAKQPGKVTIQSTVEAVLSKILQKEITIYASGRTDKGVHALNQVADFEIDKKLNLEKIKISINKLLPSDIYLKSIEEVNETFSSRLSAKAKHYFYVINYEYYDPLEYNHELFIQDLNFNLMEKASKIFIGKHNFQNFTSKEEDQDNFIREIFDIRFTYKNGRCLIYFSGSGFMRYQIRKIVQTLIEIGKGKIKEDFICIYLNKKEREIVSYTAEAKGLFLDKVDY